MVLDSFTDGKRPRLLCQLKACITTGTRC